MTNRPAGSGFLTEANGPNLLVSRQKAVNLRDKTIMTQGLYARTAPTPSGEASVVVLQKDPNQNGVNGTGRLWGYGATSGKLGYSDDDLATFVPWATLPAAAAGLSPCQIELTSGVAGGDFMFVLFNSSTANQGGVWRCAAPGASPAAPTWQVSIAADVTNNAINGPAGTAGHASDGTNFRNQCFAIKPDGSQAALVNYAAGTASVTIPTRTGGMSANSDILYLPAGGFSGSLHGLTVSVPGAGAAAGTLSTIIQRIFSSNKAQLDLCAQTDVSGATVTFSGSIGATDLYGGPTVRISNNPCASDGTTVTWSAVKTWAFARHGHACRYINGILWASIGDYPYPQDGYADPPLTHVGVWAATDGTSTAFTQKMRPVNSTLPEFINFLPVTIGGQAMIVGEFDGKGGSGLGILPTQSNAAGVVTQVGTARTSLPLISTARCVTVTPSGNLMWLATGEGGAVGPVDAVMWAAPPFDTPIMLEQMANNTIGSVYNAVVNNGNVYWGTSRISMEKALGQ